MPGVPVLTHHPAVHDRDPASEANVGRPVLIASGDVLRLDGNRDNAADIAQAENYISAALKELASRGFVVYN